MAGRNLVSSPPAGIASLNDVFGFGGNVNLTSTDGSVVLTPDASNKEVDLSVNAGSTGIILESIPCDATVYVGAMVRMDATGTAFNALADAKANSNVMGVCTAKTSTTECTIRVSGATSTLFTGLDTTKDYFLSDTVAGAIQTTPPTDSGHVALKIGKPLSATRMVMIIGERYVRA